MVRFDTLCVIGLTVLDMEVQYPDLSRDKLVAHVLMLSRSAEYANMENSLQ